MQSCMYRTRSARITLARPIFSDGEILGVRALACPLNRRMLSTRTALAEEQIELDDYAPSGTPIFSKTSWSRDPVKLEEQSGLNSNRSTSRFSGRFLKRVRPSPPTKLAGWVDENMRQETYGHLETKRKSESLEFKFNHHTGTKSGSPEVKVTSLPSILIDYLERLRGLQISPAKELAFPLDTQDLRFLEKRGYEPQDIATWAYILYASESEVTAKRFLSHDRPVPSFLLLEILRREDISSRTLKALVIYCWNIVLSRPQPDLLVLEEDEELEKKLSPGEWVLRRWKSKANNKRGLLPLEEEAFMVMVSRLLQHARRTWPTAVVSIAKMVSIYLDILRENGGAKAVIDGGLHRRLVSIYNITITRLALPSRGFPMKSMYFNWLAQRMLLERAGDFEPPLEIDQGSYRAVMSVLAASKKSENEISFSRNVTRSWPPWRTEQDGIDAARVLEADLSRTSGAIRQMMGAGYHKGPIDKAIGILGGREPDGTPTIQTRLTVPARLRTSMKIDVRNDADVVWVARVQATRDIKEAWSAFLGFEEEHPKGSLAIYHAMFEKLVFEKIRPLHRKLHNSLPGDGKEVSPVSDETQSLSERMRTAPPDIDALYQRMIHAGIKPSGDCLRFLVSHARTIDTGIRYLQDSDLSEDTKIALITTDDSTRKVEMGRVSDGIFLAFVQLLCRFAYCSPSSSNSSQLPSITEPDTQEQSAVKTILPPTGSHHDKRLNPLLHAVRLIIERKPNVRPPWYALFAALARKGTIVDLSHIGLPRNDIMCWKVLETALRDSQRAGIELDSKGYLLVCTAFGKALVALRNLDEEHTTELNNGPSLLKELFARMTEDKPADNDVPKLVHVVEAASVHAHIRVMGALQDTEEVVNVMQWMVNNQEELTAIDTMSRNGPKMRRRCLVAARCYLEGDEEAEERAKLLVESMKNWGGWPSEEEMYEYRKNDNFRLLDWDSGVNSTS